MRRDYVLSCESTVDLTPLHLARRNIAYIGYPFQLDGRAYRDDLGQTLPFPDFYAAMAAGAETATGQINVFDYVEYFEPFLQAGRDVLHLCNILWHHGHHELCPHRPENLWKNTPTAGCSWWTLWRPRPASAC